MYLIIFVLTWGLFILFSFIASDASLIVASCVPFSIIMISQKPG